MDYEDVLRKLMLKAAEKENAAMRKTWGSTLSTVQLRNRDRCIETGKKGGRPKAEAQEAKKIEQLKAEIERLNKLLQDTK